MKKFYYLLFLFTSLIMFGQGLEDFTNSNATASYSDNSFVGNNGITWTYVQSRDQNGDANGSGISGNALMLRRASSDSKITSSAISGGIGDFSVKLYKGFTGAGDRQVELFVNGISYGTSTVFDDFSEHTFSVNGINITGNVVIEIKNTTEKQVIIDDITWTAAGTDPSISITDPSDGSTLDIGTTSYDVTFSVSNFSIPADGHVHVQLDGSNLSPSYMFFTTDPITISNLTPGSHSVKLQLVDANHNPLSPDVYDEVTFTIPSATNVADLASLRSQSADGTTIYTLTGEAYINYAQSFRNQKFIQDATAGILIDDSPGNITSGARGDGLSGITGTLSEYNGMLQFVPVQDATLVSPSTLTITPQMVTLSDLATNFEDYEAELVQVEPVLLDTATETTFVNGTEYTMTETANNTDTFGFYTNFYDVDYITTTINTAGYSSIVGLTFERADGGKFAARDLADFTNMGVEDVNTLDDAVQISNTLVHNEFTVFVEGSAKIEIFNSNGQLVKTMQGNDAITVQTSGFTSGAYMVRITQDNQSIVRKIMKQ